MAYILVDLNLAGEEIDKLIYAARNGLPMSVVTSETGGRRVRLPLTRAQANRLGQPTVSGRGRKITMTKLQAKKAAGFFEDLGRSVGEIGEDLIDGLVPGEDFIRGKVSNTLAEIGLFLDELFTGKQFNAEQAAANHNSAITKAKAFLALSKSQQDTEYNKVKNAFASSAMFSNISKRFPKTLAAYIEFMTKAANRNKITADEAKQLHDERKQDDNIISDLAKYAFGAAKSKMGGQKKDTIGKLAASLIKDALLN